MADTLKRPNRKRQCQICGDEMIWLPLIDRFGRLYRWRAHCDDHGFARREAQSND